MTFQFIPFSDGSGTNILTTAANLEYDTSLSSIRLGSGNTLSSSLSVILGGTTNSISSTSIYSGILNGNGNAISSTLGFASIIGSTGCTITKSFVSDDQTNAIVASTSCTMTDTHGCFIGGAFSATILQDSGGDYVEESVILGTYNSSIHTYWSAIIASEGSTIKNGSHHSAIVGSQGSTIDTNADHGFIGGGYIVKVSGKQSAGFGSNLTVSGLGSFGFCDHTLASSTLSTNDAFGVYVTNGAVISDTGSVLPNSKAVLTLSSTVKGFLPPVMTTTQKTAITSPPAGLTVYDSTLNKLQCFDGTIWQSLF